MVNRSLLDILFIMKKELLLRVPNPHKYPPSPCLLISLQKVTNTSYKYPKDLYNHIHLVVQDDPIQLEFLSINLQEYRIRNK